MTQALREINNPAIRYLRSGDTLANSPWLIYVSEGHEMRNEPAYTPDPIPLEGGPRLLEQGWYVCEILDTESGPVCRVRRVADEDVQRVVLNNRNDISVVN